ncbi:MAG: toxin-antitoxin system YwqK family antitoxin [Breznakibacter sp.]
MPIFFLTVIIHSLNAQSFNIYQGDTINRTDATNLKQGLWITFDASGKQIVEQGNYINNKKEGTWIRKYPNGNTKHEITFKNGMANGDAKFYFENGSLWETGTWVIDHWVGPYQFYHPNGQKAYDWNYNNLGKRNGPQKYYHDNGKLKYSGTWQNGKTVGNMQVFDEKGVLISERVYENGKFETSIDKRHEPIEKEVPQSAMTQFTGTGQHSVYNLAGQIEKSGYFINGNLMDGYQLVYDQDGNLTTRLLFEKGNLVKTIPVK